MHFQKVPRLGCFMAIPLVYNSCLSNEALEEAVEDYLVVSKEREEQDRQKAEYEAKRAQDESQLKDDEEDKDWTPAPFAPFKTFKEEYIICMDTLGQDRQFSNDQKRFTLHTILSYKEAWEAQEVASLTADRDRKLELMKVEKDENAESETQQALIDAMEFTQLDSNYFVETLVSEDAVFKEIHDNQKLLQIEAKWMIEKETWQKILQGIKAFRVIKMPTVLQALFFMVKIERENICEPGSNKLSWKKAKELITTELPTRMKDYKVFGEKKDDYRPYMRINYVESIIAQFN